MKQNVFVKYSLVIFLLLVSFSAVQTQQTPLAGFDAYVNKALKDWEVPCVAIAVVKDDKVVLARGYGVKNVAGTGKVDEQTLFGIASNSKAFTAAAIAMLVDEGKLKWDDPVIKHLPDFQLYDPYVTREITIRDLLSHKSGLPAYGGDIIWWGGDYSREDIVKRVRFVKPAFGFRSRYAYQNIPFIIAGQIIQAVTGKSWDEFVSERILKPLNMSHTTTSITKFKQGANITTPHMRVDDKVVPIAWRNLDNGAAAAGLNSNAFDMTQWLRFQLNEGNWEGKELISAKQIREMHSPQTIIPFQNSTQPGLKTNFRAYGLGWDLREYMGYKVVRHGGWTDGQLSMTAMIPDLELGVVVLTNIHNRDIAPAFIYRIFDAYMGQLQTDWSALFLKQIVEGEAKTKASEIKRETERAKDSKPTLDPVQYAGKYSNDLYGEISFKEEKGKLVVRLSHSPTYIGDLEHWQQNQFRIIWRDPVAERTFVTFTVNEQGKVASAKMAMADFIDPSEYEYRRN